jgi:hypothetical protein
MKKIDIQLTGCLPCVIILSLISMLLGGTVLMWYLIWIFIVSLANLIN